MRTAPPHDPPLVLVVISIIIAVILRCHSWFNCSGAPRRPLNGRAAVLLGPRLGSFHSGTVVVHLSKYDVLGIYMFHIAVCWFVSCARARQ